MPLQLPKLLITLQGEDEERNAEETIRNLNLGDDLIDSSIASVELDVDINQAVPAIPKIDLPKINIPKTKLDLGIDLRGSREDSVEEDDDDEEDVDDDDEDDGREGTVQSAKLAEEAKRKMQKFLNNKLKSMRDLIKNKLNLLQNQYFNSDEKH